MKLLKGKIIYVVLISMICIVSCRSVNAEILFEDDAKERVMSTNSEMITENADTGSDTEATIVEEEIAEDTTDSLEEFRDVLEVCNERLLTEDRNTRNIMSTYLPGEKSYSPVYRDQLDGFSKKIYDRLVEFTESGEMLYGTESGTTSVSANSVLVFEYQTSEEAKEKYNRGEAIEYFGKNSEHPVNTLEQLLRDTAYLAFAAFKWDHPEIYYLESDSFRFTYSGQTDETKSTTISAGANTNEKKYLGRVVFTIEVANEKNGGKTLNGKKEYFDSFINSCYEEKVINPDYSGKNTVYDTKYIYNPEKTKASILAEKEIIENNKQKVYEYVEESLAAVESEYKLYGKSFTDAERNVATVKAVNEWVCNNTYYNKHVSGGYSSYATPKVYEMSSVLSNLIPRDSTMDGGLTGRGDINAPICEGYSKAMKYLLSEYDITADVIAGYDSRYFDRDRQQYVYSGNHMWNGVLVGNNWYALDTTWNVDSYNKNAYTLIGDETKVSGSLFKDRHYPLGTFWGSGVGRVEFPTLSHVSYEEHDDSDDDTEEPKPNAFYIKGNNVYYYDSKCRKVTGFKIINGNKYYFKPSKAEGEDEYGSLETGFFTVGKATYYRDGSKDTATEFTGITKGYVYLSEGMSRITKDNAGYYYFNTSTGVMLKGFQNVIFGSGKDAKKQRFYFGDTGKKDFGKNRRLVVKGKTYFVDADGAMLSGLFRLKYTSGAEKLYFAGNNGLMFTGNKSVVFPESLGGDDKKHVFYFKKDDGAAAHNEIAKAGSNISYFGDNYEKVKLNGFVKISDDYYYFANSVNAKKGFADISLKYNYIDDLGDAKYALRKYRYYFDKDTGKMALGFTAISNKLYYFSEDAYFANETSTGTKGKMETGIVRLPNCSKDYLEGNTNTFYMLKNGGMYTGGLVTATKEFGVKDAQKFEYYFSSKERNINGKAVRLGEAVGGYLSFDGKELLKAANEYTKNTPYHFDENTGARRRMILYYHGGYYAYPIADIQREVMKSISSYSDADLNFGNNDIIFATMSDDYPVCASSYIPDEKRGQAVDMDGKLLSSDSRVIYNPANDYVNYDVSTKSLRGGITGVISNEINEYGSNLVIKPGIKEYTYIEKSKIPDEDDIKYTVSFNVLNVERSDETNNYVNQREVYNFENKLVKTENYSVSYNKALHSESDGIVNVFDTESYCKATYKWCIDTYGKENVLLVGASSGAGICTSLIQWAAAIDKDLVAEKTVLISPWLDASMAVATNADKKRKGNGVDYETLCYWGKRYTLVSSISEHTNEIFEKGYDAKENYLINYAFASPVTISERQERSYVNLNDIYIFTGTNDACMGNGYTFAKSCVKKSGTKVAYTCYAKESHGFIFNINDSNTRKVINMIANLKAVGL